jgi:hypothetical protein
MTELKDMTMEELLFSVMKDGSGVYREQCKAAILSLYNSLKLDLEGSEKSVAELQRQVAAVREYFIAAEFRDIDTLMKNSPDKFLLLGETVASVTKGYVQQVAELEDKNQALLDSGIKDLNNLINCRQQKCNLTDKIERLTTELQAERERGKSVTEILEQLLTQIRSSRRGSMGDVNNVYCTQIEVSEIAAIEVFLNLKQASPEAVKMRKEREV